MTEENKQEEDIFNMDEETSEEIENNEEVIEDEQEEEETKQCEKEVTEEEVEDLKKPVSKPKSKGTDKFRDTIKNYLDDRASRDELFAVTYKKENKNLDDCIKYIINTVEKSGFNGFDDAEIYSMAVHYYDEDNIDPGKDIDSRVVINHKVELTPEEIEEARKEAIREVIDEAKKKMEKKKPTSAPVVKKEEVKSTPQTQATLF